MIDYSNETIISILDSLYAAAKESFDNGEIPVAAAVVDSSGNIVSIGNNNRQSSCSVIGHAEILSILEAESKLGDWRLDGYNMFVSLIPCHMCVEVIKESRLDHIFYLCDGKSNDKLNDNFIKIVNYSDYENKFSNLLTLFFNNMR